MRIDAESYRGGYDSGQHDMLTLLACRVECCDEEDHDAVAIADRRALMRYRLWCLSHNLAVAAGLCRAFELGRDLQHALTIADESAFRQERERNRTSAMREYFHPGCGRSAP